MGLIHTDNLTANVGTMDIIGPIALEKMSIFLQMQKKNKISRGIFLMNEFSLETSYFVPARNENVDTAKDSIRRPTE